MRSIRTRHQLIRSRRTHVSNRRRNRIRLHSRTLQRLTRTRLQLSLNTDRRTLTLLTQRTQIRTFSVISHLTSTSPTQRRHSINSRTSLLRRTLTITTQIRTRRIRATISINRTRSNLRHHHLTNTIQTSRPSSTTHLSPRTNTIRNRNTLTTVLLTRYLHNSRNTRHSPPIHSDTSPAESTASGPDH